MILAGRPYHVDEEICHGIDRLALSLGFVVVSEDSVAHLAEQPSVRVLNQWTYHGRLYRAARYAAEHEDTELVQLVSFGCGVDAITTDEVRRILEDGGKYCLEIKGLENYAPDGTLWSYCATEGKLNGFTAIYKDDTHADVTATRGNAPNGGYIINTGDSYSLTVSKTVTGNYADRNYYFPFTVSMADAKGKPFEGSLRFIKTGAPSGDVDAELTFSGGQAAFTLCHGESITFAHVPDGMIYSVTEERSGARE